LCFGAVTRTSERFYGCPVSAALDRPPATRSALQFEIVIVLLVSLGQSAVYAVVSLIAKLTAGRPLSQQTATLNPSQSPRPYLDLTYQLLGMFFALVPVLLALYLLGHSRAELGIDQKRPAFDLGCGLGLAAAIGIPGLLLVYVAAKLGLNAQIIPAALQHLWWAVPVLILSAIQNAVLEEVIVVGYLIIRLRSLGARLPYVVLASAVLRGSYHVPGRRRVHRKRRHGRRVRAVLPAVQAHHAADRGAQHSRHGRVRGLPAAAALLAQLGLTL